MGMQLKEEALYETDGVHYGEWSTGHALCGCHE